MEEPYKKLLLALLLMTAVQAEGPPLYRRYVEARRRLAQLLNDHDQVLLHLTPEQRRRDFSAALDGLMPVTPEGVEHFEAGFRRAYETAQEAREAGQRALRECDLAERSQLLALLPIWGLRWPVFAPDGHSLFFVQESDDNEAPLLEQQSIRLSEGSLGDTLYRWDLRSGDVTPCPRPADMRLHRAVSPAAGGRLVGCRSKDLVSFGAHSDFQLGPGPLRLENAPPIPMADRVLREACQSADGTRVVFIGGTCVDQWREQGWRDEKYHLILWEPRQGRLRSLLGPLADLHEPVLSADGSTALVSASADLWLVPTAGGAAIPLPRPEGTNWQRRWEGGTRALSGNGQTWLVEGQDGIYLGQGPRPPRRLGAGSWPTLSGDGRLAACSVAQADGTWQIFLDDLERGQRNLVSADERGHPWPGRSRYPQLSPSGQQLVFTSELSVVPGTVPKEILAAVPTYRARRLVLLDRPTQSWRTLGGRL